MELNKEILRWVLMIGAAPIWLPFVLTLWNDFNDALREEGGLLGSRRRRASSRRSGARRPSGPSSSSTSRSSAPGTDGDRGSRTGAPAPRRSPAVLAAASEKS
jgi:hypothetical protein